MKVKHDRKHSFEQAKKVRVETENWIFDLSECKVTGNLIINKVDGVGGESKMSIFSRYSNEIEVK
jgi:hypothetical protein